MKNKVILSINLGNFGSTGSIMRNISAQAIRFGFDSIAAYPGNEFNIERNRNDIILCNKFWNKVNQKLAYYTGFNGCFSYISTMFFLRKLDRLKPQLMHLHNLHNSYINLPLLFKYVKKRNIPVVWTLHDCWAFTGQCPHFTMIKCDKWKTGCYDCPSYREYPQSKVDRTKTMWGLKKKWFTGVHNMTIVTPSQWLADLVKQSYLKDYPIRVINNGIDLAVFKPTPSDFRKKYGIHDDQIMLLGVSFVWDMRKGLDVFIELSKRLNSEVFRIVLVGTNDEVDKKLPSNIVSLHRTHDKNELAAIYTAADLFVNPTREENYPTVNMEAIACGTPVVTFETGGSPEIIDADTGKVVKCDDIDELQHKIEDIVSSKDFSEKNCLNRASRFDQKNRFNDYIDLYNQVIKA